MHFLRTLPLVATAMLAACGGGSGVPASSKTDAPVLTLPVSRFSVTFMGFKNSNMVPNPEVVNVALVNGSFFINTSQTRTMFPHSFTADRSAGRITITPAYPSEAGIFTGTVIVNGCSNATGPCNHVAGSPRAIDVTYNASGLHVTPAQLSFSSTQTMQESQTVTLAVNESALVSPVHGPWSWQISPSSANLLSLRPRDGTARTLDSSTPSQTVSVTANRAGLSPDVYGATVAFRAPPGESTYMTVTLTV